MIHCLKKNIGPVFLHQGRRFVRVRFQPGTDFLHADGFSNEFSALNQKPADGRERMPGLAVIGYALERTIGQAKPGRALDLNEEQLDPAFAPEKLQTKTIQRAIFDGSTIMIFREAGCCLAGKEEIRRHIRRS